MRKKSVEQYAKKREAALEKSLSDMIKICCAVEWTAFTVADRKKLDRARKLVAPQSDAATEQKS